MQKDIDKYPDWQELAETWYLKSISYPQPITFPTPKYSKKEPFLGFGFSSSIGLIIRQQEGYGLTFA